MGGDEVVTKSGLMTGLGETKEELFDTFGVLREHGVQVLTVGQYLRPTRALFPGGALLAPRRVRRARARGVRDRLRATRGRPLERASYDAEQTLAQASSGRAPPGAPPRRRRRCASVAADRRRAGTLERTEVVLRADRAFDLRGRRVRAGWRARTSASRALRDRRRRWSRVQADAAGAQPHDGRAPTGPALRPAADTRATRSPRPTSALLRYGPGTQPWRRLPAAPTPRAAHAAAFGATGSRGGRVERLRLAALAGDLRLCPQALEAADRASPARRATTRPAWPRRPLLRAGLLRLL